MSVTRPRPVVPEELPKILHDLSYAVIKNNPPDIVSFAADFFQQLYDEREGNISGEAETSQGSLEENQNGE